MTAKKDAVKEELIQYFIDRYLPREEIIHRLPLAVPIGEFWPELTAARKQRSVALPLPAQNGEPFWFTVNKTIEEQCDAVAKFARKDIVFDSPVFEQLADEAVLDEAVFSSIIEGAFTSRKEAAAFIYGRSEPKNRSEQMVKNNYDALAWVLEHLEEPITEETVIRIAKIITRNAAEVQEDGYRTGQVFINNAEGPVYIPPEASAVPAMMAKLIDFIHTSELHPVLKACIAHFYLVYVHPFGDGNGRTARALSLMMLLQSGYGFFRYFSISDIVAKERGKYYRSMKNVEDSDGDMTYFIDCYSGMLAGTVRHMEEHLVKHVLAGQKMKQLKAEGKLNDRQNKGIGWLLESGRNRITVEEWKKKYKTAVETARQDLLVLCEQGLMVRSMEGRKAVFRIELDKYLQ